MVSEKLEFPRESHAERKKRLKAGGSQSRNLSPGRRLSSSDHSAEDAGTRVTGVGPQPNAPCIPLQLNLTSRHRAQSLREVGYPLDLFTSPRPHGNTVLCSSPLLQSNWHTEGGKGWQSPVSQGTRRADPNNSGNRPMLHKLAAK